MSPKVFKFFDALTYCSPAILLIGILLGIFYYKRLDRLNKLLLLFLVLALMVDLLSRFLGSYYRNNLILIPIYGLLELLLLSRIYFKHLLHVKGKGWLILLGALVCYNLYEIFVLSNIEPGAFNSLSRVFDSLAIVVMSIVYYIKQIASDTPKISGFLFLNTVIFAFHSLNFIIYLPINFLINETSDIKFHFWTVSLILTLIYYSSIVRMIWIHGKNQKH